MFDPKTRDTTFVKIKSGEKKKISCGSSGPTPILIPMVWIFLFEYFCHINILLFIFHFVVFCIFLIFIVKLSSLFIVFFSD